MFNNDCIFCLRAHVVCLVRGDVLELLELQWVTNSHPLQSTEHQYLSVSCLWQLWILNFISWSPHHAVHSWLSCLFTLQGARGNDGLPGPAGPPVSIIVPTLNPIHPSDFSVIMSLPLITQQTADMNPNLQIFVLSAGACWSCWSSRFPRISRSQGLYRSHYHKPVFFDFFLKCFNMVDRSLFSLVRWNKNPHILLCLVLVVIFYKLLYNLVKTEKDALIVMSCWVDLLRQVIFLKYIKEHVRMDRTSAVLYGGTHVRFTGTWNVQQITLFLLVNELSCLIREKLVLLEPVELKDNRDPAERPVPQDLLDPPEHRFVCRHSSRSSRFWFTHTTVLHCVYCRHNVMHCFFFSVCIGQPRYWWYPWS